MPPSGLTIPVFDADNHLYETRDALTKFLPDRYKGAIDYVDVRGRTKIVVRGRISEYIPNPTFEVVARPGEGGDRPHRLAEDLAAALALGVAVAEVVLLRAERAIEELEWVLERGARVVLIRPAPVPGYRGPRSFGLPEFDPFWEKVVEADLLVAMHSSDRGYERFTNEWMGSDSEMLPFQPQAFQMLSQWRPVQDAVSALICHGALSRFPQLKVAVIENGSSWVEPLLRNLADVYKKMPQDLLEHPVTVFKRNIHVSPFWGEDLAALAELIGVERVLFGSDYPHPEGLAGPASYADELAGLPDETVRKIMGGNLARLMNVEDAVVR